MNALSDYSTSVDKPVTSRITKVWSRRFKVYRETRSVFHQLIKNMNLRREQMWYQVSQIMAGLIAIARQEQETGEAARSISTHVHLDPQLLREHPN